MSKTELKKITCPYCLKQQNIEVYSAVNTTLEPELRTEVLNLSIFQRSCAFCDKKFKLKHPLLYNDMSNRFMVYFIPDCDNTRITDNSLEEQFKSLKSIPKRIVGDIPSFYEKISIFESGLDDMAVEISKLAGSETIEKKKGIRPLNAFFSFYDREVNTIGFNFLINSQEYLQSFRLEIYDEALSIIRQTAQNEKNLSGFLKIDREWAENILYRYKHSQHIKNIKKGMQKNAPEN